MSDYMQQTYGECRARFLELAQARGAQLAQYSITERGMAGEALALDTAYFGPPAPRNVLLLLSGTHGIEGFAGSAVQQQFLNEDLEGLTLPEDGAVLLVHAVNPYGFSWWRRANEHNVDLNRNFLDHWANPVRRPDYVALDTIINPPELTDETDAAFVNAAMGLAAERGMAYVQDLLTNGQYECPRGVYYGGAQAEASNLHLRQIFRTHVAGSAQAFMIDFHTGLGDSGEYTILTEHPRETSSYAFLEQTFPAGRVETVVGGESISAELSGEIGIGIVEEIPGCWFVSSACEYGTVPGPQVMQAMRHENWLHHYGDRSTDQGRGILAEIREAFCPDSDEWRAKMLAGGRDVIGRAWRALFDG